ncbi:MAG: hypothetical protein AAF429_12710 [Pseudomonadota bacterium]
MLADTRATLIVNRGAAELELYFHMAGDQLEPIFGVDPNGLISENDHVTYQGFLEGTFDEADKFIERIEAKISGNPLPLEAMSMMLHPRDFIVPFATPFDATLAIGVCNAETPTEPPHLSELNVYSGFYAYQVDGFGNVEIQLPKTGRDILALEIKEFVNGAYQNTRTVMLNDNQMLELPAISVGFRGWLSALLSAK